MTRRKATARRRQDTLAMARDVDAARYCPHCDTRVDDDAGEIPEQCPQCDTELSYPLT
jgi:NADH pyrophosphatase NudC (nudix superfamily)